MAGSEFLSSRVRWALLLAALAATLAAIAYDPDMPTPRPARAPAAQLPQVLTPAGRMPAPFAEEADGDPFASHGWTEPTPVGPPAATAQPATAGASQEPPAAPVAPPLPFRYIGKFSDDAGQGVIYLARGERTLIVRPGDTVDGSYRILGADAEHIEFEHLETQTRQTLSIPRAE
jgi:hypothetical protein